MSNKDKALETALLQIERQFGKNTVMRMGDNEVKAVPVIPTGSAALNSALGIGGYPRGRIIEVYGPESSGKTTLSLHAIAEVQKMGGKAAFIDAEHALDPVYAENLGVNVDDLLLSQPDCGEQALEIVDMLTRSGALDIIVVDSVAALTPKAELEGDMGDSHMGLQARLMSQALRKLTGAINNTKTTVFFINQIRMKIGVMFGNPETTTGGNALKFYASMRLDVRRTGSIKKGDEILGNDTKVKVVKNKMAPPFKLAMFRIMFGEGISYSYEVLNIGLENQTILKGGAWYTIANSDNRRFQGEQNLLAALKEEPELVEFITSGGEIDNPKPREAMPVLPSVKDLESKVEADVEADVKIEKPKKRSKDDVEKDEFDLVIEQGIENGVIIKKKAWVIFDGVTYRPAKLKEMIANEPSLIDKIVG